MPHFSKGLAVRVASPHPAQAAEVCRLMLLSVQSAVALVLWGAEQGVTFLWHPLSASVALNCPANTTSFHPAGTPVGFVLDIFDINSVWHNVLLGWIGSLTPLGCIESQKPSHPLKNTPTRMAPLAAAVGDHQLLLTAA